MSPTAQRILEVLGPELGPHTAGQALRVACKKARVNPDHVTEADLSALCEHIERMCRTLLGKKRSQVLVSRILGEGTTGEAAPEGSAG